ncbi:SHOCT domain-containing protein [Nostoc sp.]|uniref:SHOCT domain-containing protein n=1 Tax=Nostoc sp. TaxID=1180 RepID=UPI003FA56B15
MAAEILTQEEYESKKAAIQRESLLVGKIKQLENARDAGIITGEEFENKKLALHKMESDLQR